jgi:ATP-dependent helicase/nuclease subunit A
MLEFAVPPEGAVQEAAESLFPDTPGRTPWERREAVERAAHLYKRLCQQPELALLMEDAEIHREVFFALERQGRVIRGAIDSLLLLPGRVVVIDYKTGTSRPEHQMQMEIYLEAAQCLFPERDVEGLIFYPEGTKKLGKH